MPSHTPLSQSYTTPTKTDVLEGSATNLEGSVSRLETSLMGSAVTQGPYGPRIVCTMQNQFTGMYIYILVILGRKHAPL